MAVKRALVLSGGGAKGGYQVGALKHIIKDLGVTYDVITGTSVGALNGAYLAQYPKGNEIHGIAELEKIWRNKVSPKRIWKHRWQAYVLKSLSLWLLPWSLCDAVAFLVSNSVYKSEPLQQFVRDLFDPVAVTNSGKELRVGAVSLTTGRRRVWTERDTTYLTKAVLASSSYPVFFEPIEIDGEVFTDDGIREITPLEGAIQAGATEIDVITLSDDSNLYYPSSARGLDIVSSLLSAMTAEIDKNDLRIAGLYNIAVPLAHQNEMPSELENKRVVKIRHLHPETKLKSGLDFSPNRVISDIDLGYRDAHKIDWLSLDN